MKTASARSVGRSGLAEYYRELLEEQAQSELSVTEFAEEVGLSAATLYSWRRRLAGSPRPAEGDLLEVQVTDAAASAPGGTPIVLTVDGRLRIELQADFDAAALARLLHLLSRC